MKKGRSELAQLLAANGFGRSEITVLEALGGEHEEISRHVASDFGDPKFNALNICAIDVVADANARVMPLASGLDDSLFVHDGQITKREIRAVTLSTLAPRKGELLWDIGAGSGSISIEWMLCDPAMRAIAIEENAERCRPHNWQCIGLRCAWSPCGDRRCASCSRRFADARRDLHRRRR
jgi:precorrin-6Y C5,15-methyltransferase (decarboxylating)